MSDPKSIIRKLLSVMNERELTDALRDSGVDVTQATINRIKKGGIKRTSFEIGMGLMKLHESKFPRKCA